MARTANRERVWREAIVRSEQKPRMPEGFRALARAARNRHRERKWVPEILETNEGWECPWAEEGRGRLVGPHVRRFRHSSMRGGRRLLGTVVRFAEPELERGQARVDD